MVTVHVILRSHGYCLCHIKVTWLLCSCHIKVTWLLCSCHIKVTWLLCSYHIKVTWLLCSCHIKVTWLLCSCHIKVTWLHGCHVHVQVKFFIPELKQLLYGCSTINAANSDAERIALVEVTPHNV